MPVSEFLLPDLGEGLAEAEIVRWLVEEGDEVAADQPVVEVETAKARVEIPSPWAGRVSSLPAPAGSTLSVGDPLVLFDRGPAREPGNDPGPAARVRSAPEPTRRAEPPAAALVGYGPRPVASPVVRRLAAEHGVDLGTVHGTGPGGLVTREDVRQAADRGVEGEVDGPSGRGGGEEDGVEVLPLTGARLAAARTFERSHRDLPTVTCWLTADTTELVRAAGALGPGIGVTALMAAVCLAALADFPDLNARVSPDGAAVVRSRAVGLSLAVRAPGGLRTPVVHAARPLPLQPLADEISRLTGLADEGRLSAADLAGGTFTLNNYGPLGVDGATPLLNHPEGAMLGIGRMAERPWAVDGVLCVRTTARLSLTFDHRLCDGERAAAFLRRVAELVRQPLRLLETGGAG